MGDAAWNEFVTATLMTHCCGGSILDMRDGRVWGSSEEFGPRTYTAEIVTEAGDDVSERVNECDIMASLGRGTKHAHGLRFDAQKYMIVRFGADDDGGTLCYGKKSRGGCCVATGAQTVVFGAFDENLGQSAGNANIAVEKCAAYLRSVGY